MRLLCIGRAATPRAASDKACPPPPPSKARTAGGPAPRRGSTVQRTETSLYTGSRCRRQPSTPEKESCTHTTPRALRRNARCARRRFLDAAGPCTSTRRAVKRHCMLALLSSPPSSPPPSPSSPSSPRRHHHHHQHPSTHHHQICARPLFQPTRSARKRSTAGAAASSAAPTCVAIAPPAGSTACDQTCCVQQDGGSSKGGIARSDKGMGEWGGGLARARRWLGHEGEGAQSSAAGLHPANPPTPPPNPTLPTPTFHLLRERHVVDERVGGDVLGPRGDALAARRVLKDKLGADDERERQEVARPAGHVADDGQRRVEHAAWRCVELCGVCMFVLCLKSWSGSKTTQWPRSHTCAPPSSLATNYQQRLSLTAA